jgi:hypothetical protein
VAVDIIRVGHRVAGLVLHSRRVNSVLELWEEDLDELFVKDYDVTFGQHQMGNGRGDRRSC